MKDGKRALRARLLDFVTDWGRTFPSHNELESIGRALLEWKMAENIQGLWDDPPLIISTTIDDGLGQGLRIINLYSEVAGLSVMPIGLLQPVEKIIGACSKYRPDMLGLTVLQFDSEEMLIEIKRGISPDIKIIAGGPVFTADSDLAERVGVHFVAKNVAAYLRYLLQNV
ncbi:MAG: cobalamin B12-binding domain-containing protein [Pseudomonadota bacterium]